MSTSTYLGKYQILGELGKGGFATVYRARDPDLGREVALKVLDPLLTRDPVWVARFRREAWTVASLDHPRVVAIYEIGQAEGTLYIAMKLVEGGSLKQRIELLGPLSWDEIVRLTGQIAETLDFAHAQGILHRDLKPANVLLDPQFGALLTDFGFARLMTDNSMSISMSGGVVGTPTYIAPELWEDKDPSRQTDVYALGCVIYELVTGQALFTGSSTPAVMRAHFQPRKLPEVWPEGTPARLNDILLTALAQDPNGRYATAGELAAALAALRDDPLAAPYAALQEAMAQGRWPEVLALAGQVRSVDAGYRDVTALEAMALARLERVERVKQATGWRSEAQQALADGDFKGAELALQKWQNLTPDDAQVVEFRARLLEATRSQQAIALHGEAERQSQQAKETVPGVPQGKRGKDPDPNSPDISLDKRRDGLTWAFLGMIALAIVAALFFGMRLSGSRIPTPIPAPVTQATTNTLGTTETTADREAYLQGAVNATWTTDAANARVNASLPTDTVADTAKSVPIDTAAMSSATPTETHDSQPTQYKNGYGFCYTGANCSAETITICDPKAIVGVCGGGRGSISGAPTVGTSSAISSPTRIIQPTSVVTKTASTLVSTSVPTISATLTPTDEPASDEPTAIPTTPVLAPTPTSAARSTPPVPTRTLIPAPTPDSLKYAVVASESANLRSGPAMSFPIVQSYRQGVELQVLGRTSAANWLKIQGPDNKVGWMAVSVLTPGGAVGGIPIVSAPPVPTPTSAPVRPTSPPSAKGCYLFQNQLGAEVTITFTARDQSWSDTFKLPMNAERQYCLDPGRYNYTLDAPPPWGSANGEVVVNAGDYYLWPIRGGN